jgi:hypothetical protein
MKNTNLRPASLLGIILFLPFFANASRDTLHNAGANNVVAVNTSLPVKNTVSTDAPVAGSEISILYRVQILALQHPITVETVKVDGVDGKVYSTKANDLTRYYMGEFHDLGSANQFREELVKNGFEDACIVAYKNGSRITIKESLELLGVGK